MDRKKTGFSKLLCLWVFKCDAMLAVGLRSCNVFEEIYGIRRKMTKREMGDGIILFFVFFFWRNFWFEFVLMFTVLVWLWIVLRL